MKRLYPQVTPQVLALLGVVEGGMDRQELQERLHLTDREYFRTRYLKPALAAGLVEMTIPEKPNSRLQKYRLTGQGEVLAESSKQGKGRK